MLASPPGRRRVNEMENNARKKKDVIRSSKINLKQRRVKLVGDATPAERHVCPYCGFYSRQFRFFCVAADAARREALQTIAPVINSFFLCLSEEQLEEDKLHSNGGKVSSSPPPHPLTPNAHPSRLLTSGYGLGVSHSAESFHPRIGWWLVPPPLAPPLFHIPAGFIRSSIRVWSVSTSAYLSAPIMAPPPDSGRRRVFIAR